MRWIFVDVHLRAGLPICVSCVGYSRCCCSWQGTILRIRSGRHGTCQRFCNLRKVVLAVKFSSGKTMQSLFIVLFTFQHFPLLISHLKYSSNIWNFHYLRSARVVGLSIILRIILGIVFNKNNLNCDIWYIIRKLETLPKSVCPFLVNE